MPWLPCATGEALTCKPNKRGINTMRDLKAAAMLYSVSKHERDVERTPDVLALSRVILVKLLDYAYITMTSLTKLRNEPLREPKRWSQGTKLQRMTSLSRFQSRFSPFPLKNISVNDTKDVLLLAGDRVSAYFSASVCIKNHSGAFMLPDKRRVLVWISSS